MDDIEKALRQAKASIEFDGLRVKEEYTKLVRSVLSSEISEEEFKQRVKELIIKEGDAR